MSQLIFVPSDSHLIINESKIIKLLMRLQFISNKSIADKCLADNNRAEHFLIGDKFLNCLTFMGCAPNIQIEPDKNNPEKKYCSVKVLCSDNLLLFTSNNMRPPKCPDCKKGILTWNDYLENQAFNCQHCDAKLRLDNLNWKQQAGYGKTFIVIENIYPQEAHPTSKLLQELHNLENTAWEYFYHF